MNVLNHTLCVGSAPDDTSRGSADHPGTNEKDSGNQTLCKTPESGLELAEEFYICLYMTGTHT